MPRIAISGIIIPSDYQEMYDFFGVEGTSPKKVKNEIANINDQDEVIVSINSVGGDVWSGSEIYTALKQVKANVTVEIVGLAASAASVIAMAGDTVKISPTAQIMIHDASTGANGNKDELMQAVRRAESADESMRKAYQMKTGLEDDVLYELMNVTTWMSSTKAIEMGFADELLFEEKDVIGLSACLVPNYSLKNLNKFNEFKHQMLSSKNNQDEAFLVAQATLNLLKLKGESI